MRSTLLRKQKRLRSWQRCSDPAMRTSRGKDSVSRRSLHWPQQRWVQLSPRPWPFQLSLCLLPHRRCPLLHRRRLPHRNQLLLCRRLLLHLSLLPHLRQWPR